MRYRRPELSQYLPLCQNSTPEISKQKPGKCNKQKNKDHVQHYLGIINDQKHPLGKGLEYNRSVAIVGFFSSIL